MWWRSKQITSKTNHSVAWVKMLPDWQNHNILSMLTAEVHRAALDPKVRVDLS